MKEVEAVPPSSDKLPPPDAAPAGEGLAAVGRMLGATCVELSAGETLHLEKHGSVTQ